MIGAAMMMGLAAASWQAASQPIQISEPAAITLTAGTPVKLATTATIDSRSIVQGQRFALIVADDVMIGSLAAIPRGTPAVGEVESLTAKGMFGKAAKFLLRPLFIEIDGKRLYLTGEQAQTGNNSVAAAAVTTALIGVLGVVITGKSATLPPGSIIHGAIRSDVSVRPGRPAPAP